MGIASSLRRRGNGRARPAQTIITTMKTITTIRAVAAALISAVVLCAVLFATPEDSDVLIRESTGLSEAASSSTKKGLLSDDGLSLVEMKSANQVLWNVRKLKAYALAARSRTSLSRPSMDL